MTSLVLPGIAPGTAAPRAGLRSAILRVPLLLKILGANLLAMLVAAMTHAMLPADSFALPLALATGSSFVATGLLVWIALRPVTQLEDTAARVSAGDFEARVPASILADRSLSRLSATMNRLLDRIAADRARIQYLAGRAVRARDIERESVARELRDSFAQTLTAIAFQVEAARRASADSAVSAPLEETRELVQLLGDEMRSVAETLYPGTLAELGLRNAIAALARRVSRRSCLLVECDASLFTVPLQPTVAAALYRVADEALRNVEQHANATHARVLLRSGADIVLEIEDDGRGLDMAAADPLHAGLGLFSARAVLALAGGELQISSAPDCGTRVTARVPADRGVE